MAETLELGDENWALSFQSRVGREEWLKPYTNETLIGWGRSGPRTVDVVCPGFSADCLETLEEIAMRNNEFFQNAGGEALSYIPALNARDDHIAFLTRLIENHCQGWPEVSVDYSSATATRAVENSSRLARDLGASQ